MTEFKAIRSGKISSSKIGQLLKAKQWKGIEPQGGTLTYLKELLYSRMICKDVKDHSASSADTDWGHLIESYLSAKTPIGSGIIPRYKETQIHPKYSFWCGTPDYLKPNAVGDYKALNLANHMSFIGITTAEQLKDHDSEKYWQLVSNAAIFNKQFCELYLYCPTESEWPEIEDYGYSQGEIGKVQWLKEPLNRCLPDAAKKYSTNIITFEPLPGDIDSLEVAIITANTWIEKQLNK